MCLVYWFVLGVVKLVGWVGAMRLGCLGVEFGLLWFDCAFGGWFWLVGGGLIAGC